jgi:hypothetical protein
LKAHALCFGLLVLLHRPPHLLLLADFLLVCFRLASLFFHQAVHLFLLLFRQTASFFLLCCFATTLFLQDARLFKAFQFRFSLLLK